MHSESLRVGYGALHGGSRYGSKPSQLIVCGNFIIRDFSILQEVLERQCCGKQSAWRAVFTHNSLELHWDLCQFFSPLWPQWALWIIVKSAVTLECAPLFFSISAIGHNVQNMCCMIWKTDVFWLLMWLQCNLLLFSSPRGDCVGASIICRGEKVGRFLLPFSQKHADFFCLSHRGYYAYLDCSHKEN